MRVTVLVVGLVSALFPLTGAGSAPSVETDPFRTPGACSESALVFVGPTLIDGTGALQREVEAVVVESGRIGAIVPTGRPISCAGQQIDAKGLFLIPGLGDMHVHLFFARETALPLLLAHGITGARDMGGDVHEFLEWRRGLATGDLVGPRLRIAGPMLESPAQMEAARERGEPVESLRNHWPVADEEEARRSVRRLAELGVDFVKARSYASEEVLNELALAAGEAGLDLVGHPLWSLEPEKAARAGMVGFEHGFYPWPPDALDAEAKRRLIGTLVAEGTALVPTLVAWEPRAVPLREVELRVTDRVGLLDLRRRYLAPALLENWREGLEDRRRDDREGVEGWRKVLDRHAAEIGAYHAAGVRVLPGTDLAGPLVYPGSSLHEELALFVEKAGMTPMEALQSATRDAAEFLHLGDTLGTLEPGKEADMVLLAANPLEDIRNLAAVRGVVARGRYFDAEALDRLLDEVHSAVSHSD